MSIVLGKLLVFNITDSIRISLENLPLLMAGIFFGPFIGAAVGAGADIIGCLIVGYSINPDHLGRRCIYRLYCRIRFTFYLQEAFSAFDSGFSCSRSHYRLDDNQVRGTLHLLPYADTGPASQDPTYIGIGILEFYIVYLMQKNKAFSAQLDRIVKK